MSENNHWALHKQMSRHIDGDGFIANLARGFWCRLGVFVGFDKQNTVAAYFTSVPVCQAVHSKDRSGSNTYNGEFDAVVHFQLFCSLFNRLMETVWRSCLLLLPLAKTRERRGHRHQNHVKTLEDHELVLLTMLCVSYFA